MIFHDVAPRSQEWYTLRLGIPTSSEFHKILTPTGKQSKQADGYANTLLAEWMTGHSLDSVETEWMVRGQDLEDEAIKAAEFQYDIETEVGGFFTTDDGMAGCSPDRRMGDKRLLEIKCPKPSTHVGYMRTGKLEDDYNVQLQGQMWIAERDSVEIVSYCPGLPTVIISVARDEKYIELLRCAVTAFVDAMLVSRADLENRFGPFVKAEVGAAEDPLGITNDDVEVLIAHHWGAEA